MLIAEVQGQVIGYSRVFWEHLDEGIYIYNLFGFLVPEWRRQGIDAAMLTHNEARLRQIAATHPEDEPRFFQTWGADTEKGVHALAVRQGYEAIRYTYDLVRNLSEPFPEAHLPVGLEIRN